MAGVLDLAQIFQFVEHGFNQGASPQQGLIEWRSLNWRHVFADLGNERYLLLAQALDQPLGDIALVRIDPAKQIAAPMGDGLAVIDIAGSDFHAQQFTAMVDGDMQFKAKEPAGRTLAMRGDPNKHAVPGDTQIIADGNWAGIENADGGAFSLERFEQST